MNKISIWLEAARPKTLIASVAPVLIGTTMAIKVSNFSPFIFFCTLCFGLFIQIGTNYANDYFDFIKGADTEFRKGPRRVTQKGLVSLREIRWATFIYFCSAALMSCYLIYIGGWIILLLAILAIFFGILYTAGPFSLAYMGLGDIFVFIFFGPVATAGTYYLQTLSMSKEIIIAGFSPGLLSMAILLVNNLRDIEEDRLVNKKTTPVRFGKRFAQIQYLFAIVISAIISMILKNPLATMSLIVSIPSIKVVFTTKNPLELNTALATTGMILATYVLFFCIGWVL